MPINKGWNRKLAYPLDLHNAPTNSLETLKDASELLAEHFLPGDAATVQPVAELLIRAAESGTSEDIAAATQRMVQLLQSRNWWKGRPGRGRPKPGPGD